jgi:hypothetical protein
MYVGISLLISFPLHPSLSNHWRRLTRHANPLAALSSASIESISRGRSFHHLNAVKHNQRKNDYQAGYASVKKALSIAMLTVWRMDLPFWFFTVNIFPVDHLNILRSLIEINDTLLRSKQLLHFQILRVPFVILTSL